MSYVFPAGYTTPSVDIEITDDAGLPVTGLVAATFPTLKYSIAGANNSASLTLSDLGAENSAFTAQGVKERGEGVYRVDLPLAAVATAGALVRLRGSASGKRVICPPIIVMDMVSAGLLNANVTQWRGSTPNALNNGRVENIGPIVRAGAAQAGGVQSITLDAGASSTNSFYRFMRVFIVSGTGAGQCDVITAYVGSTKVATVSKGWTTAPDNTSVFAILPAIGDVMSIIGSSFGQLNINNGIVQSNVKQWVDSTPNALVQGRVETVGIVVRTNTIQSSSGLNTVLDASASATDQKYRYMWIYMLTGNAAGECDQIISYAGSSKTAALVKGWVNAPTTGDTFLISPYAPHAINWQAVFGQSTSVALSNTVLGFVNHSNYVQQCSASTGSTTTSLVTSGLPTDGRFVGAKIRCTSGVGINQARVITAMTATTVTPDRPFDVVPGNGSLWTICWDDAPILDSSLRAASDLRSILGTTLTETVAGYLAAGFKKLYDVASPIFTLASVNQTANNNDILANGTYGNNALLTAINAVLTAVQNVQNNTFIAAAIPQMIELPDSAAAYPISICFADETGTAKNLDSGNPIITLVNGAGTNLIGRIGSWTNPVTGKYVTTYTASPTDAIEGLFWDISGTINGKLRRMPGVTQIVDTTAIDFTSTDRSTLNAIAGLIAAIPANVWAELLTAIATPDSIGEFVKLLATEANATANKEEILTELYVLVASSGDYNLAITALDSNDDPLQGVKIVVKSGNDLVAVYYTDADGEATIPVNNGTYTVTATKSNYNPPAAQTIIVNNADDNVDFELELLTITPSTGDAVTGYAFVYDDDNQPAEGVVVQANFIKLEGTGRVDIGGYKEATSGADGKVEFVDYFMPTGQYQIRVKNSGQWMPIVAEAENFALPNLRK